MVASAGLLFAAVPNVVAEVDALVNMLRPPAQRALAIAGSAFTPARSFISKDEYLRSCLDVPKSLDVLLRPATERSGLLAACRDTARAVQAEMPTYALPYLVEADVSAALGEPFAVALERARDLAPHVHWLADRRVVLARARMAQLDDVGRAGFERDLAELFGSAEGRRALAMHYLRWPDMRERLTNLAEAASHEVQRDFLAKVRQQAGGGS